MNFLCVAGGAFFVAPNGTQDAENHKKQTAKGCLRHLLSLGILKFGTIRFLRSGFSL